MSLKLYFSAIKENVECVYGNRGSWSGFVTMNWLNSLWLNAELDWTNFNILQGHLDHNSSKQ